MKILVVDDDLDILVVMEILLTMKGFEVEVTAKWENTFEKADISAARGLLFQCCGKPPARLNF